MHVNVRVLQQEIHNTECSLEAEMAGRLNVQTQINHWLELPGEAFSNERSALTNAEQTIDCQQAVLINAE